MEPRGVCEAHRLWQSGKKGQRYGRTYRHAPAWRRGRGRLVCLDVRDHPHTGRISRRVNGRTCMAALKITSFITSSLD